MYPPSFRRRPESSIAARIAEEDKHRVKDKGNLLPRQIHLTAEDAEGAEENNDIIHRPFVASEPVSNVKLHKFSVISLQLALSYSTNQLFPYLTALPLTCLSLFFDYRLPAVGSRLSIQLFNHSTIQLLYRFLLIHTP
jgi:hypothetical protein